jgi:DNA-binding MarR family transcriptional regulator
MRMPRGDDRRVINLKLTDEGNKLAEQLPTLYGAVLNRHFIDFTADEVETLKTLLRKLLATEVVDGNKQDAK